jgi:hypothetical protein
MGSDLFEAFASRIGSRENFRETLTPHLPRSDETVDVQFRWMATGLVVDVSLLKLDRAAYVRLSFLSGCAEQGERALTNSVRSGLRGAELA